MLESEAKTKWCPHARMLTHNSSGNRNADGGQLSNCKCIGSSCMMWEDWTPVKVLLDYDGKPMQRAWSSKENAQRCASGYGKYKAVPVEDRDGFYEYHYDGKIEPCGDCGMKTKESGCGYPG